MKPHVIRKAGLPSYCSTLIELFAETRDGEPTHIGVGTGFFYRIGKVVFLVTNWHVVTGRHPEKPGELLPGYPISPTHIQLHIPDDTNRNHFRPGELIPLYDEGRPIWLETPAKNDVDIVLLPLRFPDTAITPAVQDFAPYAGRILVPGVDVTIIGFPFGRNKTNPFPIWKKAMIASEPAYTIDGKAYTYLDTPGRPGMSGSPVYALSNGFEATAEEKDALSSAGSPLERIDILSKIGDRFNKPVPVLEFVGVYSGSYGDQSLDRLNLGRFWPAGLLGGYENKLIIGQNPYPPFE
ncbi:trypsin-like peptidase domain-containing protein [Agrobacterium sp. S2]|nr:trypsin-like peptidase domain-containing protein [Agrobacterium sp. S2]